MRVLPTTLQPQTRRQDGTKKRDPKNNKNRMKRAQEINFQTHKSLCASSTCLQQAGLTIKRKITNR